MFLYILSKNLTKLRYIILELKRRESNIWDKTHSHSLQIILITLAQFAGDHGLGLAHVIDRSLNCNDALEIKAIDIVDTADGDLGVGVLHNSFDRVTTLPDNSSDEIIVRENLQGDLTVGRQ